MINFLPFSNIRQGSLKMEDLLDGLWFKILDFTHYVANFLDLIFAPLNFFGPAVAISTIAFITVILTKILTKIFKTKRYQKLQMEFSHWYNIRQEALKCEDYDKGKRLAKNIDQAKLNQVYYNYFFEGFMLGIATKYLPILLIWLMSMRPTNRVTCRNFLDENIYLNLEVLMERRFLSGQFSGL